MHAHRIAAAARAGSRSVPTVRAHTQVEGSGSRRPRARWLLTGVGPARTCSSSQLGGLTLPPADLDELTA
jgi:hypothetical protein